ncbi:MAG: LPXTG cell wall anchor domain-containing protein [Leucobacter sp.]
MSRSMMSSPLTGRHRVLSVKPLLAIVAFFALIFTALPAAQAHAADAPPAGNYHGSSSAYTGATVSFGISESGQLTSFDTTSYIQCGLYPTGMTWAGIPSTSMVVGEPLDLSWEFSEVTYHLEDFVVNADGTASGEGYASMQGCQGYRFTFTASNSGGSVPDPDPQPGVPTVTLEKEGYFDHELQRVGMMIRGTGYPAETDVEFVIRQNNNDEEVWNQTVRSDVNGEVYHRFTGRLEHGQLTGNHRLTLTAESGGNIFSDEESFRVSGGGDSAGPLSTEFNRRTLTATPQELTQAELLLEGLHVTSDDMDGRVDTAQLIVDGKIVTDVPVTEIADEFGAVDFTFTHGTLPAGEHEVALRTVHRETGMNAKTWERVAWQTFTVTGNPSYEPTASVNPTSVTESALAGSGVTVTGAGFAPSSEVALTVAGAAAGTADTNSNGDVSFTYTGTLAPGSHNAVLSSSAGDATVSFTVTEDPVVYNPEATVSPGSVTVSDMAETGVTLTGTGFAPNEGVTLRQNDPEVDGGISHETKNADSDGRVTFTFIESLTPGTYSMTLASAVGEASTSFIVTEDPVVYEPTTTVSPGTVTESDLAETGVTITGEGFAPGSEVSLVVNDATYATEIADADGNVTFTYIAELSPGTVDVHLGSAEGGASASFTVTEDAPDPDPEYDPSASVTPGSVTESEFAESGVTVSGEGFAPASAVTFSIDGDEVSNQDADDNGDVSFVYTGALVPGSYEAELSSADGTATASFTVTEDPVVYDPSAMVSPGSLTQSELADGGITVVGEGFAPESTVAFAIESDAIASEATDSEGGVTFTYTGALDAGDYEVMLSAEEGDATALFTVTEDAGSGMIPSIAPVAADLDPALEGAIAVPGTVEPGSLLSVDVTGAAEGDEVGVWLFSDPVYLGAHVVNADGTVIVAIPADTSLGEHRVGVWAGADDVLIGWDALSVTADGDGGNDGDAGGEDGGSSGGGADASTGAGGSQDAPGGDLAETGSAHLSLLVGLGALLLAAGTGLVVRARRRTLG